MWEEIGGSTARALDHHDRVYRWWARRGFRDDTFVGFIVDLPGVGPVASGCLWIIPAQPHPRRRGLEAPYLLSMFTEPEHRRRGFARKIVRAAVRWSRANGYSHIILHAATMGRPLYEKEGFVPTHEMRLDLRGRRPRALPHRLALRTLRPRRRGSSGRRASGRSRRETA
jgi:GNAT superfamily N-acetyltransferase